MQQQGVKFFIWHTTAKSSIFHMTRSYDELNYFLLYRSYEELKSFLLYTVQCIVKTPKSSILHMTKLYPRDRYRVADNQALDLPTPLSNRTVAHEVLEDHMED